MFGCFFLKSRNSLGLFNEEFANTLVAVQNVAGTYDIDPDPDQMPAQNPTDKRYTGYLFKLKFAIE